MLTGPVGTCRLVLSLSCYFSLISQCWRSCSSCSKCCWDFEGCPRITSRGCRAPTLRPISADVKKKSPPTAQTLPHIRVRVRRPVDRFVDQLVQACAIFVYQRCFEGHA